MAMVIYDLAAIASGIMTVIFIAILIDAIKNEFFWRDRENLIS